MKKLLCFFIALFMIVSLAGCSEGATENNKLSIVTASFPEYDFARAVAGNLAEIKMLIPPAGEVHGYEPTVSDVKAVGSCDLFIYTGGESTAWAEDILSSASKPELSTIATIECVDNLLSEDGHKAKADEHIWTSPQNAILIVKAIEAKLSEISPENKTVFETNSKAYCEKLYELDKNIRTVTQNTDKDTLVFGDRFPLAYFAESYSLNHKSAFSGCSEDTEASASAIADLIDFVKENNIPVVFVNELSNTSIAEQIANETGAQVMTFYSCHKISKDDFENNQTYVDIMSRNIESLKLALK